jgi:hypothetical protein
MRCGKCSPLRVQPSLASLSQMVRLLLVSLVLVNKNLSGGFVRCSWKDLGDVLAAGSRLRICKRRPPRNTAGDSYGYA